MTMNRTNIHLRASMNAGWRLVNKMESPLGRRDKFQVVMRMINKLVKVDGLTVRQAERQISKSITAMNLV